MTVLVTGGAGFIGSHATHALVDAGERVVVVDNLASGFKNLLPRQAHFVLGDIGDEQLVREVIERFAVRSILHFAASVVVSESVAEPLRYYRNNTLSSLGLIAVAASLGVQEFIFSSTSAVYAERAPAPTPEDAPTEPISPYGWSKLFTERMLQDVAAAGDMRYVILRYFNACGADPQGRAGQSTPNATHLMKVAVEVALGKRHALQIYGSDYPTPDGTCVRDYIHVSDLADAHVECLRHLRAGGSSVTLNCGYGKGYSVREVVDAVARVSGRSLKVEERPRRAGDRPISIADCARLKDTIDWKPKYDRLDTMVAHALAWERELPLRGSSP